MSITELTPYSYTLLRPPGWFCDGVYQVRFEGRLIREVSGDEQQLDAIIFLLNAAYQLGHADGSASR